MRKIKGIESIYDKYKEEYPKLIVFIKGNDKFYNTYKDDALILWGELGYKNNNGSTGFSESNRKIVLNKIKNKGLGYVLINDKKIIDINNYEKLYDGYLNIVKTMFEEENRKKYLMYTIDEILKRNPDLYEEIYNYLLHICKLNNDNAQVSAQVKPLVTSVKQHVEVERLQVKDSRRHVEENRRLVDVDLLLNYCLKERTLSEITMYFGYKDKKKFKNKFINPLLNSNKIKLTIPDKPRSSKQKYISVK